MAVINSKLNLDHASSDIADSRADLAKSNISFLVGYFLSVAMTVIATLVALGLDSGVRIPNLSLLYVIPVVVAGVGFGLGPSLCAAILGAVAYNFFFTEPRFTLMVDDPANIWAIALLFIVGLIVSTVAFAARRRAADVALLTKEVDALHLFSRDIVAAGDTGAVVSAGTKALALLFRAPAVTLVFNSGEAAIIDAHGATLEETEITAAKSALEMDGVTRAGTYPAQDSRFDFWTVSNTSSTSVVVGVAFGERERPSAQEELVGIVRNGLILALDRVSAPDADDVQAGT